jgi:hypothetical protein
MAKHKNETLTPKASGEAALSDDDLSKVSGGVNNEQLDPSQQAMLKKLLDIIYGVAAKHPDFAADPQYQQVVQALTVDHDYSSGALLVGILAQDPKYAPYFAGTGLF